MTVLQINDLTVRLTENSRTLIENFTFALNKGDKAAIIGEEGNGKSTLLKIIYGLGANDADHRDAGYIEYTGAVYSGGRRAGYLAQEFPAGSLNIPIADYFASDPPPDRGDLIAIASELSLDPALFFSQRTAASLSGGEKVKLRMAKLLVSRPDFLLLDEPSNDIDLPALEWLENFINKSAVPLMFVSHDETLIENTANVIIHLEQLRRKTAARHTIARTTYSRYVSERSGALERQEQLARKEKEEYEKQQERWRDIYDKVRRGQESVARRDPHGGRLLKKKMKAVKGQKRRFEREAENMTRPPDTEDAILSFFGREAGAPHGKTVLDFKLGKLTAGDRILAENIKLTARGGDKICIVGNNGAGKTTLLKLVAAELLARKDVKAAYMPQNYGEALEHDVTPVGFLAQSGDKAEVTKARLLLGSMKYTADEMENPVGELSGGQKAKLLFIKMIFDGCGALILDEPTRNFSPISNPVIRNALKEFKGVIISVSHDRKFISEVCGRIYLLGDGTLKETTVI